MSLKNEITISQEFEKDFKMAEFQMEEAIKYFFLLTVTMQINYHFYRSILRNI